MYWLERISGNDRLKRVSISGLLLAALAIMGVQAIPVDFFPVAALHATALWTKLRDRSAWYATALGLRQDWQMFAPNPMRANTYIDAEITYRSGRTHIWTFPQMQELGYVERYAKERYRKFANERLWLKENSAIWPDAARYIARINSNGSDLPRTVALIHYMCVIPSAPPPGESAPNEQWQRNVFFTYTVQPGDL